MKFTLLFVMLAIPGFQLFAQESATQADKEAAYEKTIHSRAEKIVITLNINDSDKARRVTNIISSQYRNLNKVYTERDEKITQVKAGVEDKQVSSVKIQEAEKAASEKTAKLHGYYINQLSKEL